MRMLPASPLARARASLARMVVVARVVRPGWVVVRVRPSVAAWAAVAARVARSALVTSAAPVARVMVVRPQ